MARLSKKVWFKKLKNEYIFVYGTLRKATAKSMGYLLDQHCDYFSEGHVQGKLYEINGYPGAVESNDKAEKIFGEIYIINQSEIILPKLDEYEECTESFPQPHEYTRKILPVTLSGGESVMAWVYIYNFATSNLERINSGDYSFYLRKKL